MQEVKKQVVCKNYHLQNIRHEMKTNQQGETTRAEISMRRAECCRYVGENEIVKSDDHPMHETTLQRFNTSR